MSKSDLLEKTWDLGCKIIKSKGFELVDVEFIKESGNWYLRYYIDKPGGITLDDCQATSIELSRQLDIVDIIPYSYILEVSSPGIFRSLKKGSDFLNSIGSLVEIVTVEKIAGKKVFTGVLKDFSNNIATVKSGKTYLIPKEKILTAKLKPKWNEGQK